MNQAIYKKYKPVDRNLEFCKEHHQDQKENYSNIHHRYRKRCDFEDVSFGIKNNSIFVRERDLRWLRVLHDVDRRSMSVKHVFQVALDFITGYAFRFTGYATVFSAVQFFEVQQFSSIIPLPAMISLIIVSTPRTPIIPVSRSKGFFAKNVTPPSFTEIHITMEPSQWIHSRRRHHLDDIFLPNYEDDGYTYRIPTHNPRFSHPRTRINRSNATQLGQEVCRKLQNNIEINLEEQTLKASKDNSIENAERKIETCNSTSENTAIKGSEPNKKKVGKKTHSSTEPTMQEIVKLKENNDGLSFSMVNSNSESLTNSLNKTALKNDTKTQAECEKINQSIGDNMPNKIFQKEIVSNPKSDTSECITHDGKDSLSKVNEVSKGIVSKPKSNTSESITHDGNGLLSKVNKNSINTDKNIRSKSFGSKDTKVSSNILEDPKLPDKKSKQNKSETKTIDQKRVIFKTQNSNMISASDKNIENIVHVDNDQSNNTGTSINTSGTFTNSQICHITPEKQSDNITKTSATNKKIENKDKENLNNCQGNTKMLEANKKNCDNYANYIETVDDKKPSDKSAKIENTINKTDDDSENDIVKELEQLVNEPNDTYTLSKTQEVDKKPDNCIEQIENLVQEGNLISDVTDSPKPSSPNIIKKDIKIKLINPPLPSSSLSCTTSKELTKADEHEKETGNTNRDISNINHAIKPTEIYSFNDSVKQAKTVEQMKDKKQCARSLKSCTQGAILEDIFILEDALKEIDNEPSKSKILVDSDIAQSNAHVKIGKTSSSTSVPSLEITIAEKSISKEYIIEDEPNIIEISDESKEDPPTFPNKVIPPLIPKIESPNKNSNSLKNIEVGNSPLYPTANIEDFGNFDTRMTYLYSFSKYFDDTRTVDMDISHSPSPSESLDRSSRSDQQIETDRVLRDLDAMYSSITSGENSDKVNKVKFSQVNSEPRGSETSITEGESVQQKEMLIEDLNNIKDKSILEKKSLSNPMIRETLTDIYQGKNKSQEENIQAKSVNCNNETYFNEKKTQVTNHESQKSVTESLIIPQIEISKLIDKSQKTRNKINQLASNSSSRFQCGDLPSIDIDILLNKCKKILNMEKNIRPQRIYRSKSIYCLNSTTNILPPLRKTKSLSDISSVTKIDLHHPGLLVQSLGDVPETPIIPVTRIHTFRSIDLEHAKCAEPNQPEDQAKRSYLDYKDELLSLLSSGHDDGIDLQPLIEENLKNSAEEVSCNSVLDEKMENEVKEFELDALAEIRSKNKESTNNEVHLQALIKESIKKSAGNVSVKSVPDEKMENEMDSCGLNHLTEIDYKIKRSKNNSCEKRKKRVRRLDSSDEESTIPKGPIKFAKVKKNEKVKRKMSESLDQIKCKSMKDKSCVMTFKSNSTQKESSATNSLNGAITESEMTSTTTQTQKNNTLKDKYVTKAEYIKTFGRMKSPVNISLSIEPQPNSAPIKKRRATFTCESNNATILKKVGYREKCLYLFGDTSEEEELIKKPKKHNTLPNNRTKGQKKKKKRPKSKQYIEDTDASSDEVNKNSQVSSELLTLDSVPSSSVKANLKISHKRRHSMTIVNYVKSEEHKSNEHDKTVVGKLADKEAKDILCKLNVRRENSSSTDSKSNNKHQNNKSKSRSQSKESDGDKRTILETPSKHEISIQNNIVDRRHSASNDSSKSKPNYKNKKMDKQDIVPPLIVDSKRKSPSNTKKTNNIIDTHRKEYSKHQKLTENSTDNNIKKVSEDENASKPKANSEELVPRTIKAIKSKKERRSSTNKSNFICSKGSTITEHTLETGRYSAASHKRLIKTDRRKSAPDVLNSSSETSLVIDEDQTYPPIHRATENEIIETLESCCSLSLVLPVHQRISIIETVENTCEDMVHVCESHDIKNDIVVVQQVSASIEDDDVIETTPAIPMIDLTEDEKHDRESGPEESLADLLLEAKKEIQAIAEEEGLITLYRSEESTCVTGDDQIISASISVNPSTSELSIVKDGLTFQLPSSQLPADALTNIPENMDTTHSDHPQVDREPIQNIVNSSKNNREVKSTMDIENHKAVSTLLELLQDTPNQSSADTQSATVEPNISKSTSQKEGTTLDGNDNSQHSVDCQEVNESSSVVSNKDGSKQSAQVHANLTKSGYSIQTQIAETATSFTKNVLPCTNTPQQSDVIKSSLGSTTQVETLSSVTANSLSSTNSVQQLDGQRRGMPLTAEKGRPLCNTHPPTLVRSIQQSSKTNYDTVPSTSRQNIQNVAENTARLIDLTAENVELSSMDIKLIVEIFTRHIYFLTHLYIAQKAYVDSFIQRSCYKHYFKAEIELFEEQRQQRLKSQSIRLWSELLSLNIRASRNLQNAAVHLIDHITASLANKDMPKRVTRTFVYLIIGELIKPQINTFATIPLFKILIRHCSYVSEKVQSRSSGVFTQEMRRTLAHQVEEYTRLFGHPPILPNQQPIFQLNTQHDRQQQQIQVHNENSASVSGLRNLNDFDNRAGPDRGSTSARHILDINNPPNVTIRSAITMEQGRIHTTDQDSVTANCLDKPSGNVPVSQRPPLTIPTAGSGKAFLRIPATTRATPAYQQSNVNRYTNTFIRPSLPSSFNSFAPPYYQMPLVPGGFNTNSLGSTPRYLPNFDLPRTNQVYAPFESPRVPPPAHANGNFSMRNLNSGVYNGRGQNNLHGPVLSRIQTSQQESQYIYSAQGANSLGSMTPSRPPVVSSNTCESQVNNTQHNLRNSSLPQQTSFDDFRTRNTNLLKELLSTTEKECQAVFAKPASPVNDNFRIKLPFTKPVTYPIATVTTTSTGSPTVGFTISVASQPNTISPIQNVRPPVAFIPQHASQTSLNLQPSLSQSQIVSVNNTVPSSRIVADATQTSDILNQGLSALSSIGRPESMISPSPPNDLLQNQETQPDVKLVSSNPTARSAHPIPVLAINNQSPLYVVNNTKSQKQNQIVTISPVNLSQEKLKNKQNNQLITISPVNISRKRGRSRKDVTNNKKAKIGKTIETFEISSDEDCPMQQDSVEVPYRSAEAKDAESSEIVDEAEENSVAAKLQDTLYPDRECQSKDEITFSSENSEISARSPQIQNESENIQASPLPADIQPSTSKGFNTLGTNTTDKEDDIETIDLTWIDELDDAELQGEIDFIFVKQETAEDENVEKHNNRVVPSPADSGIASPPAQQEEDTFYTVVSSLCICGQIANYNCACGDASYCGEDCQLNDWDSHQKVCYIPVEATDVAEEESVNQADEL